MDITYSNIFLFIKESLIKLHILKQEIDYFIIGKSYYLVFNYSSNIKLYNKLKLLNLEDLYLFETYDDMYEMDEGINTSKLVFIFIKNITK